MNQMKLYLALTLMAFSIENYAQSGMDGFSYQAVARNASGDVIQSQNIGVQLSIISGSPAGTVEYSETHTAMTNEFGLFTLMVGDGTPVTGTFAGIDFSTADHYLKVEADFDGGNSYSDLGTTQLLSVPYAQYAKSGVWTQDGNTIYNANSARTFINRNSFITSSEYFGVKTNTAGSSYGGMYMETGSAGGRPFYGYATDGSSKAWTYFNPADSSWRMNISGERMIVKASGLVGLGTVSPEADLHIQQSVTDFPDPTTGGLILERSGGTQWQVWHSNPYLSFAYNGSRVAYVSHSTGAWTTTSDKNLKNSITNMSPILNKVLQLRPVEYYYNHQEAVGNKTKGFIAQEVEKVFPELVYRDNADDPSAPLALSYADFAVLSIKAIQEQQQLIDQQKSEIGKLKDEIEEIRQLINNK